MGGCGTNQFFFSPTTPSPSAFDRGRCPLTIKKTSVPTPPAGPERKHNNTQKSYGTGREKKTTVHGETGSGVTPPPGKKRNDDWDLDYTYADRESKSRWGRQRAKVNFSYADSGWPGGASVPTCSWKSSCMGLIHSYIILFFFKPASQVHFFSCTFYGLPYSLLLLITIFFVTPVCFLSFKEIVIVTSPIKLKKPVF